MTYHIRELLIPDTAKNYSVHTDNDSPEVEHETPTLKKLPALNVFIGINNSGKSRLLRKIFSTEKLSFVSANELVQNMIDEVEKPLKAAIESAITAKRVAANEIETDIKLMHTDKKWFENLQTALDKLNGFDIVPARDFRIKMKLLVYGVNMQNFEPPEFTRVYIPVLRGLRNIGSHHIYSRRVATDYFPNDSRFASQSTDITPAEPESIKSVPIITGLEFYEIIRGHLLGSLEQRNLISIFPDFLSNTFFEGDAVVLIPRQGSDVLFVKIGSEAEQPIHQLGDGIQQLIIMTFPLFLHHDKDLLLFIEEPETHLHPGMQRILIDTLLNHETGCKSRQVFVTTHSHQFLDITLDHHNVSVYKFEKTLPKTEEQEIIPQFRISNHSWDDSSLLAELGVRNSSVLLSNCTIWVEGITDRWYIRKFLEVVQADKERQFLEDIHFSFVEYSGSNITHWSFLDRDYGIDVDRLCGRLFLIADDDGVKDIENSAKAKRYSKLKEVLGDRFYRTECIEIENMLTPDVISAVLKEYEGEEFPLKTFTQSDYVDIGLEKFIEESVLGEKSSRKSNNPYQAQSGTLKDKVAFDERAVKHIKSVDDLSLEARTLAEKLLKFIESHNSLQQTLP